MKSENPATSIICSLIFITFSSVIVISTFVSVSADPFGIFNYENPYLVKIQGFRAHLFETHDAAHKSNVTEIVMHVKMANEEISQLLQNLSTSETASNQDSQKLNNTIQLVKMQLSEINPLANNNNMTGVMTKVKHTDKQLASLLDIVNTDGDNQTSPKI